ncbi:PQQ-binding-like beta-propeller repeat protein [Actinopolymorpha alba]|uniref:outer membrane protein assembly factor BamB family protein n=1 Tax=Actinopolymorpha alba TaxID=533267 RepID=UPI00037F4424|nr:PQQ-binding-like beta-propeller repeat protein [Actinopolymorpha alba]
MTHRPSPPSSSLDRRRFLALAGTAGALGGIAALGSPAPAFADLATGGAGAGSGGAAAPLSFAVVTDTHANPLEGTRLGWLRLVFNSIARANPAFVLNCGDITDYGADDEYTAYLSTIPDSLRPKLRHVPGNHEVRWDIHGAELYHRLFGPTPYSFDVGGLHVAGLDPTQLLQEPGHFGREHLRWLTTDLRDAGPSVLFLHYPLGAEHYYVNDQDAFFETVAELPVRAVFAGHIHRDQIVRTNGFTQVAGQAVKNGAYYYWVERGTDAGLSVLRVWAVSVAADGTETRREIVAIPLAGGSKDVRPVRIDVGTPANGAVRVDVRLNSSAAGAAVRTQAYPQQVFGGGSAGSWVDLATNGKVWSGTVNVAALAAGTHRMQVRVADGNGATYDATQAFTLPAASAGAPVGRWQARLDGSVQGAPAERDGLVVAASTSGQVEAFRVSRSGRKLVWRAKTGAVYRGPAFSADGTTVFVPSADHRLYALDARSGKVRWRFQAADPVLSSPLVTPVDGVETVVFSAGRTLYAVDSVSGDLRWSANLHGFSAGRAACDGERVYTGGGDGNAYAFDARTGAELWAYSATTRGDAYGRLLYGPWDDVLELLPDGQVLVSTVSATSAIDRATGARRWNVASGCMYTPARLLPSGLLLVDERGRVQLVDPATGVATWTADVAARAFNAGPVIDGGTAWLVAATGLLAGLDLATGEVRHRQQLGPGNTFSTPVLVDGILVTADQDGIIRGIELPEG